MKINCDILTSIMITNDFNVKKNPEITICLIN